MTHIKLCPRENSNLNFPLKMGVYTNYNYQKHQKHAFVQNIYH
jgi:hypothetical protein